MKTEQFVVETDFGRVEISSKTYKAYVEAYRNKRAPIRALVTAKNALVRDVCALQNFTVVTGKDWLTRL